jgi:hypothetical protein
MPSFPLVRFWRLMLFSRAFVHDVRTDVTEYHIITQANIVPSNCNQIPSLIARKMMVIHLDGGEFHPTNIPIVLPIIIIIIMTLHNTKFKLFSRALMTESWSHLAKIKWTTRELRSDVSNLPSSTL